MICQKCSRDNLESSTFCDSCGERLIPIAEVELEPMVVTPIYTNETVETVETAANADEKTESSQNNTSAANTQAPPTYAPYAPKPNAPISMGKWLGLFCLNFIPFVGPIIFLVFQFIWAFDTYRDETSRNWAKAHLIFSAISAVIIIIVYVAIIVVVIAMGAAGNNFFNNFRY